MALLHSLEICGVRSFSPDDKQTIKFDKPVTLFLGQNGCGKTTIIECIRFALTSELPSGSSNGQGFLNDPQMSSKTTTKGSIKIKFLDAEGNMITVSRVIMVTAKTGGGLTFKKLNFSVRRRDKNDPDNVQDISGRCMDIDSYCATALNVSKSILNNVLFCHQENSAWPLDIPQKLKEKFDEIFDAVKYNKTVDNMRKVIKEKQTDLRVLESHLVNSQRVKDEAASKLAKFNEKKDKLEEVKEKIRQKKDELQPLEKRMREILELEESLGELQSELTKKEAERKGLIEQQSTIKKHITYIFEGSDVELQNRMTSFQAEQTSEENIIRELERKKIDITKKAAEISVCIQRKQIRIGQLKEEQKQYRNKLEENKELTERLRLSLELEEFDDINDRLGVSRSLQNALENCNQTYQKLAKEKDIQEKEFQNRIDEIREKAAGTKQIISSKNNLIQECQAKLKQIRNKLEELDTSDSQLRIVEDKIEKLQATLAKLKNSFNESEKLQEIDQLKEEVESKEQLLDKLDREYRILQQNFATEQKLDSEKSLVIKKQGEMTSIKSKHSHNLQKLFGEDIPERNFKRLVQEIQTREENKFKAMTFKINQLEKDLAQIETTINHQKKKLGNDQNDLALKMKKVSDVCKGKPFGEVLKETHSKREKLQRNKGEYSSGKIMYEAFIAKFQKESPCCPICQTDFANKQSAVSNVISQLRSKVESFPNRLKETENELKKTEEFYNKLQQLQPINKDIESLKNVNIPVMQKEIDRLNEIFEEKSMELAAEKVSLVNPQELLEASKEIITDAALLDQYMSDIVQANALIEELEQTIVKVPSNRSRQETEAEIDIMKAQLSNIKNRHESAKKMLEQHRDRCQNLNRDMQAETQKQINIQKLVQEKPLLELQNTENNEKLSLLRSEVEELKGQSQIQERQLKSAIEDRQELVEKNRKVKEEERGKIVENEKTYGYIQKLLDSLNRYEANDNDNKLDVAVEELAKLKIDEEKLEQEKNKVMEDVSSRKEALAKKESQFRALKDNVTLREKQKLESALVSVIEDLKVNIGGYNYRQVYEEKKRKTEDIEKKRREISSMKGQQEEIEQQVRELEKELAKPEIKNAYNNYKKKYYEVVVNKLGIEDLHKFAVVLEKSVLKFHEERMVHINRTIRELWRSIYRGNDIDYIEIKTDENMTGGAGKRRTYNYKVVQVKNNVELEMRGRCSAGQKVLACLVIRMALAETFSAHCGILALDEPTTNLDRENILSLSDALSRIITDRERESNFQLLIITHDEDFLKSLTGVQSLDSFWKVTRNQGGFSNVERVCL
nr:DNA repair protein RAD50 [Leptinotarsa decemlineata]XP_023030235.1 DNA repair protein RAD50 [Leptinotarsa decemlineata]